MRFAHHFARLPWAAGILVDPVLKVRISTGRWEPEGGQGGSTRLEMHYDPELRADRLTMPPPAKLVENLKIFGSDPPSEVVFESASSRKIAELIFDIDNLDGEVALNLSPPASNPSFDSMASLIAGSDAGRLSEDPYAALLYMLEATPMLPIWERDYGKEWGARSVSVYVLMALAAELLGDAELFGLPHQRDLVRIARREIDV